MSETLCLAEKRCLAIAHLMKEGSRVFSQLAGAYGDNLQLAELTAERDTQLLKTLLDEFDARDLLIPEVDQWVFDIYSQTTPNPGKESDIE